MLIAVFRENKIKKDIVLQTLSTLQLFGEETVDELPNLSCTDGAKVIVESSSIRS